MIGIDKITARIAADAEAEAGEIISRAEAEAAEILNDYAARAEQEHWRIVREGAKECDARVARLAGAADLEAKKSVLALKQEMVGLAFNRAAEKLRSLPEKEYSLFLARLAVLSSRTGSEQAIFNKKDAGSAAAAAAIKAANADLTAKNMTGALTISKETRDISGGLILKDGDIEINCAIETLIAIRRNELSAQLAEALFD